MAKYSSACPQLSLVDMRRRFKMLTGSIISDNCKREMG
uniref:Uncharacterized protein n=1 Tax=Anguilla anguilla TaxID=7936 RepID=A0A0E9T019_ANGAN